MIPLCRDQGLGVSVFGPLVRGLLSGDVQSTRNQTDFFTRRMYGNEALNGSAGLKPGTPATTP